MAQEHAKKSKQKAVAEETTEVEAVDLQKPELDEDIDAILGEIDEVLEENAQEFVAGYIQKGGQ
jgi:prokaryotic ubiquitin-like protein Pup